MRSALERFGYEKGTSTIFALIPARVGIIGKANGHLTLSVNIKRQSHLSLVLSIGIVKQRPVDVVG